MKPERRELLALLFFVIALVMVGLTVFNPEFYLNAPHVDLTGVVLGVSYLFKPSR